MALVKLDDHVVDADCRDCTVVVRNARLECVKTRRSSRVATMGLNKSGVGARNRLRPTLRQNRAQQAPKADQDSKPAVEKLSPRTRAELGWWMGLFCKQESWAFQAGHERHQDASALGALPRTRPRGG